MTDAIHPVILSGGAGTRLWPLSTPDRPKQFLPLGSDQSLFRATLDRVADARLFAPPVVVGNARHLALIEEELGALADAAMLIFEPVPRNTAPAIALAALALEARVGADALMLVMPSDHVIADGDAFRAAVERARDAAQQGRLVTFGIEPSGPETGYGYIALGEPLLGNDGVFAVARFVEKPPLADAVRMVDGGGHLWNAGIFLFRASALLAAMAQHAPAMLAACRAAMADAAPATGRYLAHPDADAFGRSPSDSIDYAVFERAGNVATVPMAPGWSDVGSWDALAAMGPADDAGNRLRGSALAIDCSDCLLHADGIEIAALGLDNLIVVATEGRLLIMPRGRSQEVRRIVDARGKSPP